jgi:hypothetical protein
MRTGIKTYVEHLNCKLYYQQLHLKYLCNLNSVETCRNVIICEIIVHLLVIVQNKRTKQNKTKIIKLYCFVYNKFVDVFWQKFPPAEIYISFSHTRDMEMFLVLSLRTCATPLPL